MSEFGPLISAYTVEQGALSVLTSPPEANLAFPRLVYYLAEYERQNGLAPHTLGVPPGPSSYRGGVDSLTLMAEWFPMLHIVAQPEREIEKVDPVTYAQRYTVQVTATVGDDNEDTARMIAVAYATCATSAIADNGNLGIGATQTIITRMPYTELLDPEARQVVRSVGELETLIAPVASANGPMSWPVDPYSLPPDYPEVETVNVQVIGESLD